jgi:hypothetical protein
MEDFSRGFSAIFPPCCQVNPARVVCPNPFMQWVNIIKADLPLLPVGLYADCQEMKADLPMLLKNVDRL